MASWVHSQRKNYECLKSGKTSPLSAERIDKLEKIGFVWKQRFGRPKKGDECYKNKRYAPLEKEVELEETNENVVDSTPTDMAVENAVVQEKAAHETYVNEMATLEKNVSHTDTKAPPFGHEAILKQGVLFTSGSIHKDQIHRGDSIRQITDQEACQEVFMTSSTKEKTLQQENHTNSSFDLYIHATV